MKAFIDIYSKVLDKITDAAGFVAGLLLLLTALATFIEVVMRGVFNSPTEWAIETAVYFVLVAGFLGMPVAYKAGKHINVDILLLNRPAKTKCILEFGTSIIGIIFCAIFFWEALNMSLTSLELNNISPSTMRVPLWIPQMSLPVGMGLLTLQFVKTLLQDGVKLKEHAFAEGQVPR